MFCLPIVLVALLFSKAIGAVRIAAADIIGLLTAGSPSVASGNVQIVPRKHVKILNVGLASVVAALNQWGIGTANLLTNNLEEIRIQ